ncbi:MAG: SDR family oxidoreductase [Nitrospira sp.]|nr:SDR family oxidoreductase [Nitrospira sp.]
MATQSLQGKVVVVGAGAKNLGGLISREFGKGGAKIVVHYNSHATKPEAESTVQAIKSLGSEAYATQGDLTKPVNVAALFEQAKKHFGGVDIAINTVGKVLRKPIVDTTEEEYDSMFDINAKAAYFFIKEAGKHLNDHGKIITIVTSLLAAFTDGYSTYAGGKAPVEHFTRAAAKEFGPRGISVTAVGPGPMDTPFFYGQETPQRVAYHKSQALNGDLTKVEDIVPIVKFLATEGWWITGQTIFANGGYTTR